MKKKRVYAIVFVTGLIGFLIFVNRSWFQAIPVQKANFVSSKILFVDDGFFKIQPAQNKYLATWDGEFLLNTDFMKDPLGQALAEKKTELVLVTIINQYRSLISSNQITFFMDPPHRPIEAILNQYGIGFIKKEQIKFDSSKTKKMAQVGDTQISFKDLKTTDYRWGALKTQEFEHKLSFVKQAFLKKFLNQEAKKQKLSAQDFLENKVKASGLSLESYYIKHHPQPAIEVYVDQPKVQIDLKEDWTPHLGSFDNMQKVILFDSYFSESGQNFIKSIVNLSQNFPNVFFGFRPIFPEKDHIQRLLAEVSFCVWAIQRDKYWPFLKRAMIIKSQDPEKEYYKIINDLSLAQEQIRDCAYKQEYKEVVSYHLEYANYLNLKSGPLLYLNGFIYTGQISYDFFKKRLKDFEQK